MRSTGNRTGGSNPSLSANTLILSDNFCQSQLLLRGRLSAHRPRAKIEISTGRLDFQAVSTRRAKLSSAQARLMGEISRQRQERLTFIGKLGQGLLRHTTRPGFDGEQQRTVL
jgi:hypothetical protein